MTLMNVYVMEWLEQHDLPCIYRVNREPDISIPHELGHLRRKIVTTQENIVMPKPWPDCDERIAEINRLTVWMYITSLMRRLADLTNMTVAMYAGRPEGFTGLTDFRDYCLGIVSRISEEYKQSRRVSLDCELFAMVKSMEDNGSLFTETYDGIVMTECDDETDQATVYIEVVQVLQLLHTNISI